MGLVLILFDVVCKVNYETPGDNLKDDYLVKLFNE